MQQSLFVVFLHLQFLLLPALSSFSKNLCIKFIALSLLLCTEAEETAVPERPQVIIFATFQGVPRSPPRITRLNELVSRFISSSTSATAHL